MAKSKADLHDEAVAADRVPADSTADDYTVAELEALLGADDVPVATGPVPTEPIVAPDGHVVLSQEDIDARQ